MMERIMDFLINIDVDDLDKGVHFYTAALGLRKGRTLADSMVELTGASSRIYLLQNKEGTPASATTSQRRTYGRHWTPVHFDVVVDDIHAAVRRAEAAGARLEGDIQTHAYGHLALMGDPFGHGFCLIQWTGRGYDEITLKN
jgi:predicted enzyme related to lactoylglutathione lyase